MTITSVVAPRPSPPPHPFPAVAPHGCQGLIDRLVEGELAEEVIGAAKGLKSVALDARASADAELIATGALSPLSGFLHQDEYRSVIKDARLRTGVVFPIPITLTVPADRKTEFRAGQAVALTLEDGSVAGTLAVEDVYPVDRAFEAREVYRTNDPAHPGVAYLLARGEEVALGGRLTLAKRTIPRHFPEHHRDPSEVRALIEARGWRKTVAFQTRNPIHRAHEYLLRCALETVDGLAVHPLVGETKGDDVPASVRMRCYEALLDAYFPKDRVLLSVFPFAMRYAGPREALLHAISRQNYGFSHFIVGRDHAGVGNYYGTYDAQKIFDTVGPGDLAIVPLMFEHSFHCTACGTVASLKTCPHDASHRLALSGTRVRELLAAGSSLPIEFTRPEVAEILREAYAVKGGN